MKAIRWLIFLLATPAARALTPSRASPALQTSHVPAVNHANKSIKPTRRVAIAGLLLAPKAVAAAATPPLPTPLAPKKNPELAAALILPLVAYKAASIAQGNKLMWYLDASIAVSLAAFVVYIS